VQTRLRKLGQSDRLEGIVLAEAGLERLGFRFGEGLLAFEEWSFRVESLHARMFPAIGQGAIALQIRADREEVAAALRGVNHEPTFMCIRAERELQRLLSGDCSVPVGVRTVLRGDWMEMEAILFPSDSADSGSAALPDSPATARVAGESSDPEKLARELFEVLASGLRR
jgi:hydroxymethylbilane synthase